MVEAYASLQGRVRVYIGSRPTEDYMVEIRELGLISTLQYTAVQRIESSLTQLLITTNTKINARANIPTHIFQHYAAALSTWHESGNWYVNTVLHAGCTANKNIRCYSPYLFSVHVKLFENNYSALWYFFPQDRYSLQRCRKRACANIIFALALVHAVLLDGYVRKSPPPQHQHAPLTHRSCPRLTRPHPCRFQQYGRLSRPHRITAPQTTRPPALATGSRVRIGLQRGGQFARPHRLTTRRPIHLSAPAADSHVSDFSVT